jgi:alpha-mannosidase
MTSHNPIVQKSKEKIVYIVPHTHWDREWYLPFQDFRYQLVQLIDKLLTITEERNYFFMLDGQTIILEDYFEIRPEKKQKLLKSIRSGKLAVGPWYILPDEWLVGQESLLRNLETGLAVGEEYNIPVMNVGYLPDQFGHTRAIPAIITSLTDFKAAVLWRGVGKKVTTVPFQWFTHEKAQQSVLAFYLPTSYSNAANLPEEKQALKETIVSKVAELADYSPLPIYLLMNGSDHLFPQVKVAEYLQTMQIKGHTLYLGLLEQFIEEYKVALQKNEYKPPVVAGEFRSSLRAPLLQDTYSTRMWIKQWDAKIEDLLVHYAEPLAVYSYLFFNGEYPQQFLTVAWKWLLKNQPHDSICGCSVDQVHDEMKGRYFWSESIAKRLIKEVTEGLKELETTKSDNTSIIVFNPTNSASTQYFEFTLSLKEQVQSILSAEGKKYPVQSVHASEEILFEDTLKPLIVKSGMKMLPGRRLMDVYINEVIIEEDYTNPTICNIILLCDKKQLGEFDVKKMKEKVMALLDSKKYSRFHVKATLGTQQTLCSYAPLQPWGFSSFLVSPKEGSAKEKDEFSCTKNKIENRYYKMTFNKDGSFNYFCKEEKKWYKRLHCFEDWGDRGDEYTFGRIGPEKVKRRKTKRKLNCRGRVFAEINQTQTLILFEKLNEKRTKRIGRKKIPVKTTFRFYSNNRRIDIQTELVNTAQDHRLRICFDLPFACETTTTSTHFGHITRQGKPSISEEHVEQPSGIQPQKRFIYVQEPNSKMTFSLFNKGLPEVELVHGKRIALTLLRAVGYLSRSDFPERPIHAGPFIATPGAQELNKKYTFEYSLLINHSDASLLHCYDQSEAFALLPQTIVFEKKEPPIKPDKTIISVQNPVIRISSIRITRKKVLVTLFNSTTEEQQTKIATTSEFTKCHQIKLNGVKVKTTEINNNHSFALSFAPLEIKLCQLE